MDPDSLLEALCASGGCVNQALLNNTLGGDWPNAMDFLESSGLVENGEGWYKVTDNGWQRYGHVLQ